MQNDSILYDWAIEKMIEIRLEKPDDFLKVKETLTRIGIASQKEKTLYQTCHILFKRGKYYIIHFKEIFNIEGKVSTLTLDDVARRNRIAALLEDWGLCKVVNPEMLVSQATMAAIKVVPYKEKSSWKFIEKYALGKRKYASKT